MTTRTSGSPNTPRTVSRARKPANEYPSDSRRCPLPDFAIPHDARSPRRSKSPKANVHRPLHYFNPQNHPLDFQKTHYYLRGLSFVNQWTREANKEALRTFNKAIELDPNFASAYGMAARCYSQRKAGGWGNDRVEDITETERLARRAAELGADDAVALCTAGVSLSFVAGKNEDGAD